MSGPIGSNQIDICGVVVATRTGNAPKKMNAESTPSCCNFIQAEGEKTHAASYPGCSHSKRELQRGTAKRTPKGHSNSTSELSFAAALHQDNQHQQPKEPQKEGNNIRHPVKHYLSQQEFQEPGLSAQAASSSINNTVATIVHQIMTELSGLVSEEDRVIVIIKMVLNLMQHIGC
jgi:hypothetical protein